MANLKKYITDIENITNYKIKSKNYLQEGNSGFIWTGECASVCLNDINLLKATDVRRGTNLSIYSIINQINSFNEAVELRNILVQAMQEWVNAEDVYDQNRAQRAVDPEFPAYLVQNSYDEYQKRGKTVNTKYIDVYNKLKEISRLNTCSPERNSGYVSGYYIETDRVNNEIISTLKNLSIELDTAKTEIAAITVDDTIRVTGNYVNSSSNSVMLTPAYANLVSNSSLNVKSKTVGFSNAKEKIISNIDKLKTKVDNIVGKIESHVNKIIEYENGLTAEEAENKYVYEEQVYEEKNVSVNSNVSVASETQVAETYTVKSGDSLSSIASKYGISWEELYNNNKDVIGDNPSLIYSGMALVIPGVMASTSSSSSSSTETVNSNSAQMPDNVFAGSASSSEAEKKDAKISEESTSPKIFDDYETVENTNASGLSDNWESPYPNSNVENQIQTYNYLKEKGYNDATIAAIMGNIYTESKFDLNAYNPNEDGGGFFGWKAEYFDETIYKSETATVDEQMDYMFETIDQKINPTYSKVSETMGNVEDNESAAVDYAKFFAQNYEHCDSSTYDDRQAAARAFYNSFKA